MVSNVIRQLEGLILQDDDFRQLEASLRPFNIFEALRIVHQELRHSDFLSYLCDPNANHGLSDAFVRRLMQEALLAQPDRAMPVSSIDFDLWDLSDLEVHREWQNIDLLLLSRQHRFAVIIENKVWSSEHSNQLDRYWSRVAHQFQGFRVIGLYLSPDGIPPSSSSYIPVSYELLISVVEWFVAAMPASEVRMLMQHYAQMVRRQVLEDTELATLCRQIYARHREALDLIFNYRFDTQVQIREILEKVIQETPELGQDASTKTYIRFYPTSWDNHTDLLRGEGWTPSGRLILFQFNNTPERLSLSLHIGPGPSELRHELLHKAQSNRKIFTSATERLNAKWNTLFQETILGNTAIASSDSDALEQAIRDYWTNFRENRLSLFESAVGNLSEMP